MHCPPVGATDTALADTWRLIPNPNPSPLDFSSKAELGLPCDENADPCAWASCSLFTKVKHLLRLKRLRAEYPYLVKLNIPAGVGLHVAGGKRAHLDFWRYAGTDLTNYVVSVEDANNDH